jgi:hypothetical protein
MKNANSPTATNTATLAEVARFVVGADAPPWLTAYFRQWAPNVMVDRFVHEM